MCDSFPEFNRLAPLEKRLWVKFLRNGRREHRELDPKEPKMSGVTFVSNV